MPIKPRGEVKRSVGFKPGLTQFHQNLGFEIAAWCPDDKAEAPPTQVHFIQHIEGFPAPVVMRFKSPDSLGFLIEELARYRREV